MGMLWTKAAIYEHPGPKYFRSNVVYSKIGTEFGNWVADVKGLL